MNQALHQYLAATLIFLAGISLVYSLYCFFVNRDESVYKRGKRWLPLESVSITLTVYLLTQILGAILLGGFVKLVTHWNSQQLVNWVSTSVWGQSSFVFFVDGLTLAALFLFLKKRRIKWAALGVNRPALKYIAYAVIACVAYYFIYLVVISSLKQLVPGLNLDQKQELGFDMQAKGLQLVPILVSLVVLPPLIEELVMRGFLFGGLRAKLPFIAAAIVTSGMFAAAHLGEGGTSGLLWIAGIDTFILSMVLCYLREKTGSLWPSIGVHMIKNGLAFIILFHVLTK